MRETDHGRASGAVKRECLGSAVCDALSELAPTPVKKLGMQDTFGESGPAVKLLAKYELDAEGIYKQIKAFV